MTDPWYNLRETQPEFEPDAPHKIHIPPIPNSVYCGQCGYNLKTLPGIGRCPECGNPYKVVGIHRTGIHDNAYIEFPWKAFLVIAFELLLTGYMCFQFITTQNNLALILAGIFSLVLLRRIYVTSAQINRYRHHRDILKRKQDDKT
jgi:hypothetical protein